MGRRACRMMETDIREGLQRKAIVAALNVAGACLTDDQIRLLAGSLAGKGANEIYSMFSAALPPEDDRDGILLPYLTSGKLQEFASRAHDLVVFLIGIMYSSGGNAMTLNVLARTLPAIVMGGGRGTNTIGSEEFYSSAPSGVSPRLLKTASAAISPQQVFASVGLTPEYLSIGYRGTEPIKGNTSGYSGPGYGGAAKAAKPDRDLVDVNSEVDNMYESVLGFKPGQVK